MKTKRLTSILVLILVATLTYGQDYAFKVMANKGSNEVKSGDTWQPLKTGASLKSTDELKLVDNAYIGLIHASGKPLEMRQSGNFKVADLAAKVGGGTSVLNKYTDFILSSNAESKKNKLSATGAVHRATGTYAINLHLPDNQKSAVYNTSVTITWDTEVAGPYIVTVSNMASDALASFEVEGKSVVIDLKDPKYKFNTPGDPFSAGLMVQIKAKADDKKVSKEHMIRALSPKDAEKFKQTLDPVMGEIGNDQTAINMYYMAGFYEQNNLLIDALAAYEAAVKLEPSYQEFYDDFLLRNNLKK